MLRTHFKPYWLAFAPSFEHASAKTSDRNVPGVVLTTARRAAESMTTTLVAMMVGVDEYMLESNYVGSWSRENIPAYISAANSWTRFQNSITALMINLPIISR